MLIECLSILFLFRVIFLKQFLYIVRYKDICEKGYNFESSLDNADSNQFTNLVWKGSSKLGLGVAKKDISIDNLNLSCFFVVARYDDNPVHHLNTHKKNVLKGKFNESVCKGLEEYADSGLAEEQRLAAAKKSEEAVRRTG